MNWKTITAAAITAKFLEDKNSPPPKDKWWHWVLCIGGVIVFMGLMGWLILK